MNYDSPWFISTRASGGCTWGGVEARRYIIGLSLTVVAFRAIGNFTTSDKGL